MFRKKGPVVEVKPLLKTKAVGGDEVLSYFGIGTPEALTCTPGGG